MLTEIGGIGYRIKKHGSIFTFRKGKEDVYISKEGSWGAREDDGKLYRLCRIVAVETGEVIRDHEHIPKQLADGWVFYLGEA